MPNARWVRDMGKATYVFAAEQTSSPMTSADLITIEKAFANEADYEVIFEHPCKVWIVDFNAV